MSHRVAECVERLFPDCEIFEKCFFSFYIEFGSSQKSLILVPVQTRIAHWNRFESLFFNYSLVIIRSESFEKCRKGKVAWRIYHSQDLVKSRVELSSNLPNRQMDDRTGTWIDNKGINIVVLKGHAHKKKNYFQSRRLSFKIWILKIVPQNIQGPVYDVITFFHKFSIVFCFF